MRSQPSIITALLALTLVANCRTGPLTTLEAVRQRGVLRVGTSGDTRPFSYVDAHGRLRGLDIEAALALGQALSARVSFVKASASELIDGLVTGRYDLALGGISHSEGLERRVGVTRPYLKGGKCLLIRRDDAKRFRTLADVDQVGVKVAVVPGSASERFVRGRLKRAKVVLVYDGRVIPQLVGSGVVDLTVTRRANAMMQARYDRHLVAVDPAHPLTEKAYVYLTRRDDASLLAWLDRWIATREQDGSWQRLRERWIGEPTAPPLPEAHHH